METPVPQWMFEIARRENPLLKWNQVLDAEVRRKLTAQSGGASAPPVLQAELAPANQSRNEPTSAPATHVVIGGAEHNTETTAPPPQIVHITARVNTLGLILDNQGHVLIPIYLEKAARLGELIMLYSPDGVCSARFIGSDPKSNLTIVQMEKMIGLARRNWTCIGPTSDRWSAVLTPNNQETAQLAVWTGTNQEFGIVSNMDSRSQEHRADATICFLGQTISASNPSAYCLWGGQACYSRCEDW